jgi:hypothetical protein
VTVASTPWSTVATLAGTRTTPAATASTFARTGGGSVWRSLSSALAAASAMPLIESPAAARTHTASAIVSSPSSISGGTALPPAPSR